VVYRSVDGGQTWMLADTGLQSAYVVSVVASPSELDTLYAGSDGFNSHRGVFRSTDGGATWQMANGGLRAPTLAVDPATPGIVYAATGDEEGVFKSVDAGSHWRPAIGGLVETHTTALAVAPSDGHVAYASTEGQPGMYRTTDGGRTWTFASRGLRHVAGAIAVSHADPTLVYAGISENSPLVGDGGVWKSLDGGKTWRKANVGIVDASVGGLAVDPTNPNVVYVAVGYYCDECASGTVWKTVDGGATWFRVDNGLIDFPYDHLAISPTDPNLVFVTSEDLIYRTLDGGTDWFRANQGIGDAGRISAVAFDPANSSIAYAAVEGVGVYKSADSGGHWHQLAGSPVPVHDLAISSPDHLCAATDDGVSCTIDGGLTWTHVRGLNQEAVAVGLGPAGDALYAGTLGDGVAAHKG
jgi:photosystem II stability/assembly factor-like uncharacterized protein